MVWLTEELRGDAVNLVMQEKEEDESDQTLAKVRSRIYICSGEDDGMKIVFFHCHCISSFPDSGAVLSGEGDYYILAA